jgi:hypothetical protein
MIFYCQLYSQIIDSRAVTLQTNIPSVALIDIEPMNESITLDLQHSNNAGKQIQNSSNVDDTKWINYSCSLSPESPFKSLSVQIVSGTVPSGTELLLEANNYIGSGNGQHGISNGIIALNSFPQNIITNIGAAYTSNGTNNGHRLIYSLRIIDYSLLDYEDSTTLTITFTLTDD